MMTNAGKDPQGRAAGGAKTSYIAPATLKRLSQLSPWRTVLAIVLDWAVIAAAIAVSSASDLVSTHWAFGAAVYVAAIAVIAGRMHAFGGLVHDIAHVRFLRNRKLGDAIGDVFLAWPVLASIDGYRQNHLAHHRHANTQRDPDWVIKLGRAHFTFPQPLRQALSNALGYVVGVNAVRDMRDALARMKGGRTPSRAQKLARLGFYLAVAAALTLTGAWAGFALYWLVPFSTLFFYFLYVRSVAEHFGPTMAHSDELGASRTVIPFFWERWFFGPHNLNYHLEHHLYPSVPFYNLPALHAELMANPDYAARAHITRGYTTGLVREVWLARGAYDGDLVVAAE